MSAHEAPDADYSFTRREIHILWISVVIAVASYKIGGFPAGYIRFPLCFYWIAMVTRYFKETQFGPRPAPPV